jgi:hypothetical protein
MISPAGFTPARSKTWFYNRFCNVLGFGRQQRIHAYRDDRFQGSMRFVCK